MILGVVQVVGKCFTGGMTNIWHLTKGLSFKIYCPLFYQSCERIVLHIISRYEAMLNTPMHSSSCFPGCYNEQEAAAELGYTQATWDNMSGEEPQPAAASKSWSEFTDEEKAAGMTLGYSEQSWDGVSQPASAEKYWAELTEEEEAAAERLGYTAQIWDNDSGSETQPASAFKEWSELTNEEVEAATDLGYTDQSWDNGVFPSPAAAGKYWGELTSCEGERIYY